MIKPVDRLERRKFYGLQTPPRSSASNHLRLEQADHRLGESVPLVLDYEQALLQKRPRGVTATDVAALLDYVCVQGRHQEVFYL